MYPLPDIRPLPKERLSLQTLPNEAEATEAPGHDENVDHKFRAYDLLLL